MLTLLVQAMDTSGTKINGAGGQLICIDEVQGRVTVQERDWYDGISYNPTWPALIALNPSLSFEGAELDILSRSDANVKAW